jgi:hypothetical protein
MNKNGPANKVEAGLYLNQTYYDQKAKSYIRTDFITSRSRTQFVRSLDGFGTPDL